METHVIRRGKHDDRPLQAEQRDAGNRRGLSSFCRGPRAPAASPAQGRGSSGRRAGARHTPRIRASCQVVMSPGSAPGSGNRPGGRREPAAPPGRPARSPPVLGPTPPSLKPCGVVCNVDREELELGFSHHLHTPYGLTGRPWRDVPAHSCLGAARPDT